MDSVDQLHDPDAEMCDVVFIPRYHITLVSAGSVAGAACGPYSEDVLLWRG